MIKSLIYSLVFTATTVVSAAEYNLIVPQAPGTAADTVMRAVAEAYTKNTGNRMLVDNAPGGTAIVGVNKFKASAPSAFMSSCGIAVFNPLFIKDLPYTDADFDIVGMAIEHPVIWITRSNTTYQTMTDMIKKLPNSDRAFVAYANNVELFNLKLIAEHQQWSSKTVDAVPYKSVPDAVVGLLNGSVDVAVLTLNASIVENIKSGKLRPLAVTSSGITQIGEVKVNTVKQSVGIDQINGCSFLTISPKFDVVTSQQLKKDLLDAINSQSVRDRAASIYTAVPGWGPEQTKKWIDMVRQKVSKFKEIN